jgi:hypothetical protein
MKSHGLIDDGIQQRHSDEVVVRQVGQGIELGTKSVGKSGIKSQMEKHMSQDGSHTVASGNDDKLGVTVKIPFVSFGLGALVVGFEDVGEDVA